MLYIHSANLRHSTVDIESGPVNVWKAIRTVEGQVSKKRALIQNNISIVYPWPHMHGTTTKF